MTFSEQLPSEQWAALKFRGELIAQVWFKPDGDPWSLLLRIPRSSFQDPEVAQRLTIENLLKGAGIANDDVKEPNGDLSSPLSQPADGDECTEVHVRLKRPTPAEAEVDSREPEVVPSKWRDLESLWKTILSLEASVGNLRMNLESMRSELDSSVRRSLTADDKVHAQSADVAQWTKAKGRVHFALPKANEFIHRATWASGTPERKRLGELFKNQIENDASLPDPGPVEQELENLRKDLQVLTAQGNAVQQECKGIAADIQSALRTLQNNAASKASKKKGGSGAKGKSY